MQNDKQKIVAIVGMPGAGKSEVADYFINKKFDYLRMGQITLDEVKRKGLKPKEENERPIREGFRKKYGMGAFAILNFSKIDKFKNNVIVDGLYSWDEYLEFKKKYKNFIVIAVNAGPETRYARLDGRVKKHGDDPNMKYRSFSPTEAKSRDYAQIENLAQGGPIAMADFTIVNEGTKKELIENIKKIYRRINAKRKS